MDKTPMSCTDCKTKFKEGSEEYKKCLKNCTNATCHKSFCSK